MKKNFFTLILLNLMITGVLILDSHAQELSENSISIIDSIGIKENKQTEDSEIIITQTTSIPDINDAKENHNLGISIDGDLNIDMYYQHNSLGYDNKITLYNNGNHFFGSKNFLEDSFLAFDLKYNNIFIFFEIGFTDYLRKYGVKYSFQDKYNQFISAGRDTTLAFYQMGQVLNGYQGLTNYGALNADNRRLQIRYGVENFETALIFPYLGEQYIEANDNAFFTRTFKGDYLGFAAIPRLEFAYKFNYQNILSLKAFGSYGAYIYRQEYSHKQDEVHTASLGVGGRYYWLNKGYLDFTLWSGLNLYLTNALTSSKLNPIKGYIRDEYVGAGFLSNFGHDEVVNFGGSIAAGYEFVLDNIKFIPQIGVGYMGTYSTNRIFNVTDNDLSVYTNVTIRLHELIDIIPEIAFFHNLNNGGNLSVNNQYSVIAGINARLRF